MNNLSSLSSFKKKNSPSKERLQIRNYVISSIVFTFFALFCSHLVLKSVSNPYTANKLPNQLSACHIVALHAISLSLLFLGSSCEEEKSKKTIYSHATNN